MVSLHIRTPSLFLKVVESVAMSVVDRRCIIQIEVPNGHGGLKASLIMTQMLWIHGKNWHVEYIENVSGSQTVSDSISIDTTMAF